jgi:hypothetical protein
MLFQDKTLKNLWNQINHSKSVTRINLVFIVLLIFLPTCLIKLMLFLDETLKIYGIKLISLNL